MRGKWRVRRGSIWVHATIDVEANQILGLEIIDESILDDQMFVPTPAARSTRCTGSSVTASTTATRSSILSKNGVPCRDQDPDRCFDRIRWGGYRMWSLVTTYGMRWKGRSALLQYQTDLWGISTGNVLGGDAPRGEKEIERLYHAGDQGGLTGGAAGILVGDPGRNCATQQLIL